MGELSHDGATEDDLTVPILVGLLLFEASLVIAFYVVQLFQANQYNAHPEIGPELDTVNERTSRSEGRPHCILGALLVRQCWTDRCGLPIAQDSQDCDPKRVDSRRMRLGLP